MRHFLRMWSFICSIPVTASLASIYLLVQIAYTMVWPHSWTYLITHFGYGLPALMQGHPASLFTGLFFSTSQWLSWLVLLLICIVGAYLERRTGWRKTLVIMLATQVGSVLIVSGLLSLLASMHVGWAQALSETSMIGLSAVLFGLIGATSAHVSPTWRYRIRLLLIMYGVTALLYSAALWDFTNFAALIIVLALGPWSAERRIRINLRYAWIGKERVKPLTAIILLFSVATTLIRLYDPGNGGLFDFGIASVEEPPSLLLIAAVFGYTLSLTYGLYRGRRNARRIVLVLSIILGLTTLLSGPTPGNVFDSILYATLVFSLLFYQLSFDVRANARIIRAQLLIASSATIAIILLGSLVIVMMSGTHLSFIQAIPHSISWLLGTPIDTVARLTPFASMLFSCIAAIWTIYLVVVFFVIIASAKDASLISREWKWFHPIRLNVARRMREMNRSSS